MERNGRGYTFDVLRAKLLYGSPFVTRRPPRPTTASKEKPADSGKAGKKKRARSKRNAPSTQTNVQQLEQVRHSEDEFTELMRPPESYIKRFKHFEQMDFNF